MPTFSLELIPVAGSARLMQIEADAERHDAGGVRFFTRSTGGRATLTLPGGRSEDFNGTPHFLCAEVHIAEGCSYVLKVS